MFSYRLLQMDVPVLADQRRLSFISSCVDIGCCLEALSGAMPDRDGWQESVKELCSQCDLMMTVVEYELTLQMI